MINLYYVQVSGDTFIRHIHDVEPTHWDEDNFCLVRRLTPDRVERFGVHQLKLVTPPYYDPATQAREHGPALLIDDVWVQHYIVTDLGPDESAAKVSEQWTVIRAERNALLARTDWWVTKAAETGAIISDDQHAYRQALRDITTQSDPFNVVWPSTPA